MLNHCGFIRFWLPILILSLASCQQQSFSSEADRHMVEEILRLFDDPETPIDRLLEVHVEDLVQMPQGAGAITNKVDLRESWEEERKAGHSRMRHEAITIHSYSDMVLTRGRVTGHWTPISGEVSFPFETNNIITFRRMPDGQLKVWQVIFNRIEN